MLDDRERMIVTYRDEMARTVYGGNDSTICL